MSDITVEPEKIEKNDKFSEYIPNYLWSYFKSGPAREGRIISEKAASIEFDTLHLPDSSALTTLNVVYEKGFIVWIFSAQDVILPLICNKSITAHKIKLLTCEQNQLEKQFSSGQLPAIIYATNLLNNTVEVCRYNIPKLKMEKKATFEGQCKDLLVSEKFLVLASESSANVIDVKSLQRHFVVGVNNDGKLARPIALSKSLLAYSSLRAPEGESMAVGKDETYSMWFKDVAASAVQYAKKESYKLMDYGKRSLTQGTADGREDRSKYSRISADEYSRKASNKRSAEHLKEQKEDNSSGNIVIQDILSRRVITHFYAHRHDICNIEFDPTGLFLLSSSVEGHVVNIMKINFDGRAPDLLYKLRRGYSDSMIRSLSVSADCRYFSLISESGTSHVYYLRDYVREYGITHANVGFDSGDESINSSGNARIIMSINKVRGRSMPSDDASGILGREPELVEHVSKGKAAVSSALCEYKARIPRQSQPKYVLVADDEATINQYKVEYDWMAKGDANIVPIHAWRLARRPNWGETATNYKVFFNENRQSAGSTWFEDYDVKLCNDYKSLWGSYQFSFYPIEEKAENVESVHPIFGRDSPDFARISRIEIRKFEPIPSLVMPEDSMHYFDPTAPDSEEMYE